MKINGNPSKNGFFHAVSPCLSTSLDVSVAQERLKGKIMGQMMLDAENLRRRKKSPSVKGS